MTAAGAIGIFSPYDRSVLGSMQARGAAGYGAFRVDQMPFAELRRSGLARISHRCCGRTLGAVPNAGGVSRALIGSVAGYGVRVLSGDGVALE